MPALRPQPMEEGHARGKMARLRRGEYRFSLPADISCAENTETDKATMEFEAVTEGTIGKILIRTALTGCRSVNAPIARAAGKRAKAQNDIRAQRPCPQGKGHQAPKKDAPDQDATPGK